MFTTYAASAGSGKTTHLVADYIVLCFQDDSRNIGRVLKNGDHRLCAFQKILAITFTNNAAAEMKGRIVETLHEFAYVSKEELSNRARAIYNIIIGKLFGENPPDGEQIERFMRCESLELLRGILYDYARFTLTTIDSFFQRVIRSAALSLGLNLNYSVQVDLNEFYIKAIDQLLNNLTAGSEIAGRLVFLLDNAMEDNGKLNMDRAMKETLDILYADAEKNYDYLQKLRSIDTESFKITIRQWRHEIKSLPTQVSNQIMPIAKEADSWIGKLTFSFHKGLADWFDKVVKDPMHTYCDNIDTFRREADGSFFRKKKLSDTEQALADEVMPHIIDCFNRMAELQKEPRKRYLDNCIRIKEADKLLLLFDLQEKMEEIKNTDNFFILSEANKLIYDNIKDKETPEIFDQIKFDHFFIDEFQDTSLMQWRNLLPLITNRALATNGQVTLFGDVKQAIYRFRNGDASLFYNLINYDRMKENANLNSVTRTTYTNETLSKNYRSAQSVVAFNNEFFRFYSNKLGFQDLYADVAQEIYSNDCGMVQIFIQQEGGKTLKRDLYSKEEDLERYISNTFEIKEEEAEILRSVHEAVARGYQYGDIAILFSGNDKCTRIANILLNLNIPVITERSLVLNASPAVNLMIYTMKLLLRPNDRMAQTTILFYLSKIHADDNFLTKVLSNIDEEIFNDAVMQIMGEPLPINKWRSLPIFLLVKEMIKYYNLGGDNDPFVVEFENIVLTYLQNRNDELTTFLLWWQQLLDTDKMFTLTMPKDLNAVKVSTIHKSKGLEYPVVILPFSVSNRRSRPLWTEDGDGNVAYVHLSKKEECVGSSFEQLYIDEHCEMEIDTLNLLYVAHTRARDLLYIITRSGKEGSYGKYLSDFLTDNNIIGISFKQDEKDERVFYAGNRQWENPSCKKTLKTPVIPQIHTSGFTINKVTSLVETTIQPSKQIMTGNFVHDFLANLNTFPRNMEEVDRLLDGIGEEECERLRKCFQHILEDEELLPYFASDARVMNEISILDVEGNIHRPDRIVFLEEKIVVIDYKTGHPHPTYQDQINLYCDLLQKMGYPQVEGKLLYV